MFEDLMEKRDLTRKEKVLLFVFADLNHLVDLGILVGKAVRITPKGKETIEKLESEGFEPTEEEIEWAMDGIIKEGLFGGGNI